MSVNPLAAQGFTAGARDYERGRPSYPLEAAERLCSELGIGPGRRVVDVAAGTGKWTTFLTATGAAVLAVEPVPAMRERFRSTPELDSVPMVAATAEALPVADGSTDVVTAAQAFHWFDPAAALAEVARVLSPGGGLGLIWNERDETVPWVAELTRVIRWGVCMPYRVGTDWCRVVADAGGSRFLSMERASYRFEQELDRDLLEARVTSTSYVAAMGAEERARMVAEVRRLADAEGFPERFPLPYITEVYWARRR